MTLDTHVHGQGRAGRPDARRRARRALPDQAGRRGGWRAPGSSDGRAGQLGALRPAPRGAARGHRPAAARPGPDGASTTSSCGPSTVSGLSEVQLDRLVPLVNGFVRGTVERRAARSRRRAAPPAHRASGARPTEPSVAAVLDAERFPTSVRVGPVAGEELQAAYDPARLASRLEPAARGRAVLLCWISGPGWRRPGGGGRASGSR